MMCSILMSPYAEEPEVAPRVSAPGISGQHSLFRLLATVFKHNSMKCYPFQMPTFRLRTPTPSRRSHHEDPLSWD